MKLKTPRYTTELRGNIVHVPEVIWKNCSGMSIFGKFFQSIMFTTDIAIVRNNNADAIIAVYPFTPHPTITQAIMSVADVPVLCGVGGGITHGLRSVEIARHAEFQGALGVVLNAPAPDSTVTAVKKAIDIPVILTVISEHTDIREKLKAGVDILNVSGGANTAKIVATIRKHYPTLPIIATGGSTEESILATIEAGANSITYTPPTTGEMFRVKMDTYRKTVSEGKSLAIFHKS